MVVSLILTRALGAEQYGYIAQAISLCMIMSICCTAGIEAGSAKFMIPAVVASSKRSEVAYIKFSILVLCTLSALLYCITATLKSEMSDLLKLAVITAPFLGLSRMLSGFSIGYSNVYGAIIPRSFIRPVLFLILILAAGFFFEQISSKLVLHFFTSSVIGVCFLQIWIVRRQFTKPNVNDVQEAEIEISRVKWLSHASLIAGAIIFAEFYQSISVLLTSLVLKPEQVGLLDISLKLVGFVVFALVAVNQTFFPRNAQAFANKDFNTLQTNLLQASLIRLAFGLTAITFSILIGPTVLGYFGPEFTHAFPVFFSCLTIPLTMTFFGSPSQIISLWKSPETLAKLVCVSLVCLCSAVVFGAKIGGILGAAWGVNFGWLVWAAGGAFLVLRQNGIDTTVFAFFRKRNLLAGTENGTI